MKNSLAVALLSSMTAIGVAQQQPAPYQIQTDVLGETAYSYKMNHEDESQDCIVNPAADRFTDDSTPGLKTCTTYGVKQPMAYAGTAADSRQVRFDDDRLYEVVYSFKSASGGKEAHGHYYDQLLATLTEKFGKPTETHDSEFANQTGSHLQNQTSTWKNGVSTIVLAKFVGNLSTTELTFSLDSLEEDARQQIVATRKHRSEM
jgi:hypothetical protein